MRAAAVLLLGSLACGACCVAQSRDSSARQLVVELFTAHSIASLKITPLGQNETVKMCPGCRAKPLQRPLTATVRGDALELGSGEHARLVELEGAFRVEPDGGAKTIFATGVWKLSVAHGAMRVLLAMDSERYVALALRGEAGAQEPLESLKAMAIVVRTFALRNADRHRSQGFNLCDSTHCQALKFGRPSELVERAVRETAGETLWYGARRALAFYTQNCGGETEDARQAWPGTVAAYLKAHADPYCTRHGAAQWHADIAVSDLERVAQSQAWKLPRRIDAMRVTRRTSGGRVLRLQIAGAGASVPLTASSLRFALNRALGWNQLRSDWYTVTLQGGMLRFEGRGYGHGVGLCQAGATEMAAEAHSAAEILQFYFPGTKVGLTAEGDVWRPAREAGWTLWSTADAAELAKRADEAWAKARALYPSRGAEVEPEVWAMPTTELFRQATSEPGWMLASTQGARVFLQPEDGLRRSGTEDDTLLHEFLHVRVESEASPQTPLWLREGLVEAVSQHGLEQDVAARGNVRVIEATLAHPASQADSQRAHAQAARLVAGLIARNGLKTVREWVRSGSVPDAAIRVSGLAPERAAARARAPSTQP